MLAVETMEDTNRISYPMLHKYISGKKKTILKRLETEGLAISEISEDPVTEMKELMKRQAAVEFVSRNRRISKSIKRIGSLKDLVIKALNEVERKELIEEANGSSSKRCRWKWRWRSVYKFIFMVGAPVRTDPSLG